MTGNTISIDKEETTDTVLSEMSSSDEILDQQNEHDLYHRQGGNKSNNSANSGFVASIRNSLRRRSTAGRWGEHSSRQAKTVEASDLSGGDASSEFHTSHDYQVNEILKQLSEEELEVAARCCYEYLQDPALSEFRQDYAREMASRYLISKKDTAKALRYMKATIQFRQRLDLDGLRRAFDDPDSPYRKTLQQHLSNKMVYVQGYDKEGRATYIFQPRHVKGHDAEWTIKQHVYTLERAIACTKAKDKTVNAVIDFHGFSALRHSPPTSIGKEFMSTLRDHYIGRVNQIFLVDAPTAFFCLWTIFKPLLSKNTRSKIQFVSGASAKQAVFEQWYEKDQATPWMLPNGGSKDRPFHADEYLFTTPFHKAFDE